jgi:hypothetical protein
VIRRYPKGCSAVKELFDLLGLVIPFRFKTLLAGAASVFMGGWILAERKLIPELSWFGITLVIAGLALLAICVRDMFARANPKRQDRNQE